MEILFATLMLSSLLGVAMLFRKHVVTTSVRDVLASLEHEEVRAEFPTEARPLRLALGIPAVRIYTENVSVLYWRATWPAGNLRETIDILDQRAYAGLVLTFLDRQLTVAGVGPNAAPTPFPSEAEEMHAVRILELCSRYADSNNEDSIQG